MVKISVIIPVYNVEAYLCECLNHIVNQSFRDIEIICINDGSTDRSSDILREYGENDSRIRIIDQTNHGLGAVRNRGIELAKGDYVYFMDGDDYLELTALEESYELSKKHDLDFLIFKIRNFDDKTKNEISDDYYTMPYLKRRVKDNVFNYADIKDIALNLAVNTYGNFFKRDFISDLRFPEGLLFEDNVFFAKTLFKAKRIYFYDKFLYNRRMHEDSLSKTFSLNLLDTIEITDLLLDLIEKYGYLRHKPELYYRIFNNIYSIFENAPDEFKEDVFLEIKKRYLKFKGKWESDDYFKNKLNKRHKHIYNSAIQSDSACEFKARVKLFDREFEIARLKKENREIQKNLNKIKNENSIIKSTKGFKLIKGK